MAPAAFPVFFRNFCRLFRSGVVHSERIAQCVPSDTFEWYEMFAPAPSALYTSAPAKAATCADLGPRFAMCGLSMMKRPRGATMATSSCVSKGALVGAPVNEVNASPNQGCSPYALLSDCAPSPGTPRQIGTPAVPDSIGMVSAMR